MTSRIIIDDAAAGLRQLEAGSARCCVTSPPYFGLRDYGVEGQIGLEDTPEQYVERLVEVFVEVRRVLADDGMLWLNLGDSYSGSWGNQGRKKGRGTQRPVNGPAIQQFDAYPQTIANTGRLVSGLKNKDLIGIPWLVAFALRADGWYLRSDIIWHKPNAMPSSVGDRCTSSHEYLFMLSKSRRYYLDAAAISEPSVRSRRSIPWAGDRRNRRDVWTIPVQPYSGAHFAVMPPALVEPCIQAGSEIGDLVIDPFAGAATVGVVARRLRRRFLGVELNPDFAALGRRRIEDDAPIFNRPRIDR